MGVRLHKESNKIIIRTRVRQGDAILAKLFSASLESILLRMTWETKGLKIDGEYHSHLCFADDIHICANTPHMLQQMLQELADEIESQGLKANKSKEMMENDTPINVRNTQIENAESYIWDRDTAPETKTKTMRFNEESRPDRHHSPSTATSSRVTLEHT